MSIEERGKNHWRIEVTVGVVNGKRKRITETFIGLKSEAKAREAELKKQAKSGTIITDRKMTFAEFSEKWLNEYAKNLAPKTYSEYKRILDKVILYIGHIPLVDLKPLHLTEYYNELRKLNKENGGKKATKVSENRAAKTESETKEKKLSENTILHHYTLISNVLNKAVDWECIERNPNDKVPRPRLMKHEAKYYDIEQVQKLISCLENEPLKYKTIILLALDTGARRGELTGLEWEDIDFTNRYININKATQNVNNEIIEKTPKNNSSIRKVPITQGTVELLKEYKKEQTERQLKLGDKWANSKKVFTTEFGENMHPDTPSKILEKIIEKYDLPKITFHSLRHTSVSLLINSGVHTQIISKRVGHSSLSTTANIYSHIFNSSANEVTEKLNNILQPSTIKKVP